MFLDKEQTLIGQPPLNITSFPVYSQYCHDATWTLAYALNKTLYSKLQWIELVDSGVDAEQEGNGPPTNNYVKVVKI